VEGRQQAGRRNGICQLQPAALCVCHRVAPLRLPGSNSDTLWSPTDTAPCRDDCRPGSQLPDLSACRLRQRYTRRRRSWEPPRAHSRRGAQRDEPSRFCPCCPRTPTPPCMHSRPSGDDGCCQAGVLPNSAATVISAPATPQPCCQHWAPVQGIESTPSSCAKRGSVLETRSSNQMLPI